MNFYSRDKYILYYSDLQRSSESACSFSSTSQQQYFHDNNSSSILSNKQEFFSDLFVGISSQTQSQRCSSSYNFYDCMSEQSNLHNESLDSSANISRFNSNDSIPSSVKSSQYQSVSNAEPEEEIFEPILNEDVASSALRTNSDLATNISSQTKVRFDLIYSV